MHSVVDMEYIQCVEQRMKTNGRRGTVGQKRNKRQTEACRLGVGGAG